MIMESHPDLFEQENKLAQVVFLTLSALSSSCGNTEATSHYAEDSGAVSMINVADLTGEARTNYEDWKRKHLDVCEATENQTVGGLLNFGDSGAFNREVFLKPSSDEQLAPDFNYLAPYLRKFTGDYSEGLSFEELGKTKDGFKFSFNVDGQTWYLAEMPLFTDQISAPFDRSGLAFGKGSNSMPEEATARGGFSLTYVYLCKEASIDSELCSQQALFPISSVFDAATTSIKEESLRRQIAKAEASYENEQNAALRDWDLTRNQQLAYLGIQSKSDADPITSNMSEDLVYKPFLLSEIGYNVVNDQRGLILEVTPGMNLIDEIKSRLSDYAQLNVKDVFLQVNGHGTNRGKIQSTDFGKVGLKSQELLDLFLEEPFASMNITIETRACYGAGLGELARGVYKDRLSARSGALAIVAESKQDSFGFEGRLKTEESLMGLEDSNTPPVFSSVYENSWVCSAIEDPLETSFGQIHLEADRRTKKLAPEDPELTVIQDAKVAVMY